MICYAIIVLVSVCCLYSWSSQQKSESLMMTFITSKLCCKEPRILRDETVSSCPPRPFSPVTPICYVWIFLSYPVILSIENHCSVPQQKKMAQYLIEILGDKLDLSNIKADESGRLPSPETLKGKILVKVKSERGCTVKCSEVLWPLSHLTVLLSGVLTSQSRL